MCQIWKIETTHKVMGSFSRLISVLYTYDNNSQGREKMHNANKKCKCQPANLPSVYEGLKIVVIVMLYWKIIKFES